MQSERSREPCNTRGSAALPIPWALLYRALRGRGPRRSLICARSWPPRPPGHRRDVWNRLCVTSVNRSGAHTRGPAV